MNYTQKNSSLRIDTPLGEDVLLLTSLHGADAISQPFKFDLGLLSRERAINPDNIIGQKVTISIDLPSRDSRYINGIIGSFTQDGGGAADGTMASYKAVMVPSLWLLALSGGCKIYQGLPIPDIVKKVLNKHRISYQSKLAGKYPKWEYCAQYMESDFNFISRLMEEEGIAYYFEHNEKEHRMVLADAKDAYVPCPHQETARYGLNSGAVLEDDTIQTLDWNKQLKPARYSVNEYNFLIPKTHLVSSVPTLKKTGPGEREVYIYSTGHDDFDEGDRAATIRMEEEETQIMRLFGSSDCRAFTAGYRFGLQGYYREDMNNKEYLITSVSHSAHQSWGTNSETGYSNSFTCIPHTVKFRPRRTIPKPLMPGSQTAFVVGPEGEEIHTDEHGRIQVKFHWDRENDSSCWIRVSQPSAGAGWGFISTPRVGHEVIVDFIEGDPDRPIVTGSVYHDHNRSAYDLPVHKTRSTLKTSTVGGKGSNELRFEDKSGSEEIFIHGQKDWNIAIGNRKGQTIGGDSSTRIGKNKDEFIGSDSYCQVTGTRTEKAKEIILSADTKLTLVVGSSSIVMTSSDVKINSPKVYIVDGSSVQAPPDKEVTGSTSHAGPYSAVPRPTPPQKHSIPAAPSSPPANTETAPAKTSEASPVSTTETPAETPTTPIEEPLPSYQGEIPNGGFAGVPAKSEYEAWKIGPVTGDLVSSGTPSIADTLISHASSSIPNTLINAGQSGDIKGALQNTAGQEANQLIQKTVLEKASNLDILKAQEKSGLGRSPVLEDMKMKDNDLINKL